MAKNPIFIVIISIVLLPLCPATAEIATLDSKLITGAGSPAARARNEKSPEDIPVGMEVMTIGNVNHIVPIGTKVYQDGDVVIFESRSEYMARKFLDIDNRLGQLDEQIKKINAVLDKIQGASPATPDPDSK